MLTGYALKLGLLMLCHFNELGDLRHYQMQTQDSLHSGIYLGCNLRIISPIAAGSSFPHWSCRTWSNSYLNKLPWFVPHKGVQTRAFALILLSAFHLAMASHGQIINESNRDMYDLADSFKGETIDHAPNNQIMHINHLYTIRSHSLLVIKCCLADCTISHFMQGTILLQIFNDFFHRLCRH